MKLMSLTFLTASLTALLFAYTNCSDADFSSVADVAPAVVPQDGSVAPQDLPLVPFTDPACADLDTCYVIQDDFERQSIQGEEFAWSAVRDDIARDVDVHDYLKIAIENGVPTTSGRSAVYFEGRDGGSVHAFYLISREFDLSEFSYITVEFDYLLISFEYYSDRGDSGYEYLDVDLCSSGSQACGLINNESVAKSRLTDTRLWKNQYSDSASASNRINQHLTGSSFNANDFKHVSGQQIKIDLNAPGIDKSKVMLRWNLKMDEGLSSADPDGAVLDNIVVKAYK